MHVVYRFTLALMTLWPMTAWSQKMVTIRPTEIDDVLINPGIGFMTFQRFNGDTLNEGKKWTEGYPIVYQEFDGDLTNENHPMTSLAYFRVYWKFIEPVRDEYRWDLIDKALAAKHYCFVSLRMGPGPTTMCLIGTGKWSGKRRTYV
jgi:hypothetical protein